MTWDGYDASVPPKLVPSGSTFPFTLTYVKGMTHMPLWDVENNEFGFLVNLVRPASVSEPSFYWDDTNINPPMPPGPVTNPPGGCISSVTPCHIWSANWDPGDNKTVNTWWYVSNTTTVPVTIMKKQFPGNVGPIVGPSQICQGGIAQFTCEFDTNTQQYRWTWPGGVDTTFAPFNILTFPTTATPGVTYVVVHGINAECGDGPADSITVTVNEIPQVTTTPLVKTICSNTATNITLTSNIAGATFAWRAWSTNPNMGGYYNSSGSIISQSLFNSGTTTDTIRYRIAATAAGCLGDSVTYKVAVHPVPNLSNNPLSQTQCNNLNTLLELTSEINGTLFSWTSISSSPNLTGNSNNVIPTDSINDMLFNSGYTTEIITYSITPSANNCTGQVTTFMVAVRPTPDLANNPPRKEICDGQSTAVSLLSNVTGASFTWICTQTSGNITGWFANTGPGTTFIDQTLHTSVVVADSVIYHMTPEAAGCLGPVTDYTLIVNTVPEVTVSPMEDTICSEQTTSIVLTATCAGTNFTWTSAQDVGSVTGNTDGSGSLINDQLINPISTPGSILYTIIPSTSSCTGEDTVMTMWVKPLPHLTNQPKDTAICNGQSTGLPLQSDVINTWFTWTVTGSSMLVSGFSDQITPTTLLDQTLTNSGFDIEWATYQVAPTATGCAGPDSNYVVTVFPVPDLSNDPPDTAICSGQSTGLPLQSHVNGTLFTWTATGSSANVTGFSDNSTPTDLLDQTLVNSGDNIEWVTYQVTPTANGCDGLDTSFVVTVYPVPDLSTTPLGKEICNGQSTGLPLQSNVTGTLFTWTATGSSLLITGFSDNTTNPMTLIDQNLVNTGSVNETVTYRIVPLANECQGDTSDYMVTVIPSPYLTNNPLDSSICNGQPTGLTLLSNVAGTQFTWTATGSSGNISGYSNSAVPGTLIDQTLVNAGFDIETVTYHVTPESSGCPGSVTDYIVTAFPVVDVFFVPNGETVCEGQSSGLSLQSHVAGATFTWTAAPSSANLSGYSDGSGDLILQTVDNAGATIETVTYSVTPEANGCPPGIPMPVVLTVIPRPAVTNLTTSFDICNNVTTTIELQADVTGSTFAWRAFGSSANVNGYSDGTGFNIVQTLTNSGYDTEWATYRVAATANGCTGDSIDFVVTVFPVADVIFAPSSQVICSGQVADLSLQSNVTGTSFIWTATGSSPEVSGYANGSGDLIQQTLYNSGYMMPWVTYQVAPTANGCTGTPNSAIVTVNPVPVVSMTVCFDTITTTEAKPIVLKGAVPPGGTFSGTSVTGSTFYPAIAGAGTHLIKYKYTNDFGCVDSSQLSIINYQFSIFNCGDTLIDIRDSLQYPTVEINGQCWMAANLNFGSTIASSQMQRDNCINEKYCYNDNPVNCTSNGGLYQWEEVMRYVADNGAQGFCPPGWHIPTEADWNTLFSFYISSGFAGNALKVTGYSGFDALLTGIRFHNNIWKFPGNDPILRSILFWSSTIHAPQKAWAHGMNEVVVDIEYTPSVSFYPSLRSNAFAVRCLKD